MECKNCEFCIITGEYKACANKNLVPERVRRYQPFTLISASNCSFFADGEPILISEEEFLEYTTITQLLEGLTEEEVVTLAEILGKVHEDV